MVKQLLLIFSILLSGLFSGGKQSGDVQAAGHSHSSCVEETKAMDWPEQSADWSSAAVLPFQSARFSGEDSPVIPSVRLTEHGRRIQVSHKFPFRVIKAGKVIDRHHFVIFHDELLRFQSGIRSNDRYIHSICSLLI
ncbi:MAG: hypothetical protein MJY84_06765 [Bacteroidales bacterium]|nr:hypothetical protein [Bacteroidales bacterium]